MSLAEKRKKRVYRNLFFISLVLLVIAVFLYTKDYFSKEETHIDDELISTLQFKELEEELQLINRLRKLDNQLLFEDNYQSTLEDLKALLQKNDIKEQKLIDEISNRIEYVKNLIEDQKENELSRINLRNQLVRQDKIIDSLNTSKDSISLNIKQSELFNQRKIDSLTDLLKKKNELLKLKETVKVISFKNTNGNTIRYLGETKQDQANGNGVGIWDTGSIYRGEWKENQRHGVGEFEWKDGQKYEGDFQAGERTGKGTYYWPSGEKYIGDFKNNKRHGNGVFYDPDGNVKFDGSWKNDKYQGK
ncbi:MORN repeat-containing protein [Psychroflexus maritimus]|uniref:MORN repeat-containing protein n=1 Tax=Psychroflexus maritimus TaxID=2714865 RepID=A0A967ABS6_9FLAO|nr:hypothetical protein [Psychroflexus maritimus]NGZ89357.1 hypothetical protein [Psychroflexus maritimus]